MPHLRHYDNLGTARFITFCCYHRFQLLKWDGVRKIFIQCLKHVMAKHEIKIFGYVLMPEHVHMVLLPPDGMNLGRVVGTLKSTSGYRSLEYLRSTNPILLRKLKRRNGDKIKEVFWQRRCYDHNCRTRKTTLEKINYCHKNPVMRGLVKDPADWKWSSYGWYAGQKDVPLAMDELEAV
jgi:putative transposase